MKKNKKILSIDKYQELVKLSEKLGCEYSNIEPILSYDHISRCFNTANIMHMLQQRNIEDGLLSDTIRKYELFRSGYGFVKYSVKAINEHTKKQWVVMEYLDSQGSNYEQFIEALKKYK